jgi:hypothetical protein
MYCLMFLCSELFYEGKYEWNSGLPKVKLSRCLSTLPSRRMEECRYSSIILDLGIRWKLVVSFMPPLLYPSGKSHWYPLDRRMGGPQSQSGCCGGNKNLLPLPGIEPRPSNLSLYQLSYPGPCSGLPTVLNCLH